MKTFFIVLLTLLLFPWAALAQSDPYLYGQLTPGSGAAFYSKPVLGVARSGNNSDINSLSNLTTPLSTIQGGTGLASPGAVNNVLTSDGIKWISKASSGGGGGGTPGGSSGQIQYNNAGAFGGQTPSGDLTWNSATGAFTVTKTVGVSFSPSATTDCTNAANITAGTLLAARLPNPSASTLGGIQSLAAVASNWINAISTSGVPSATQPAFTDISGAITAGQLPALTSTNFWVGSNTNVATARALSGDATLSNVGAITVTKTSGVAFATSATTDTTNAANISAGTLSPARGGTGISAGSDIGAANYKNFLQVNGAGSGYTAVQGPFFGAHGVSGNETEIDQGDDAVQADASGGASTITLPTIRTQNVGKGYFVRRSGSDTSGNVITVAVPGGGSLNNGGVTNWKLYGNQEAAWFNSVTTAGDYMIYSTCNRHRDCAQVTFGNGLANGDVTASTTYNVVVAFANVGSITKVSIAANVIPIGGTSSVTIKKNATGAVITSFDPTTITTANKSQTLTITGNSQLTNTDTLLVTWTAGVTSTAARAPVVTIEFTYGE